MRDPHVHTRKISVVPFYLDFGTAIRGFPHEPGILGSYSVGGGRDHSGGVKPSDAATVSSLGFGTTSSTGRTASNSDAINVTTGSTDTSECWRLLQPNSLAAIVDR